MSFELSTHEHAFRSISVADFQKQAPAAFAPHAASVTGPGYSFLCTAELVRALLNAGFVLSSARQAAVRRRDPLYARHIVRMRQVRETVTLVDAVPEIVLVNSHDGTSSYTLHAGLYRPICSNGLMIRSASVGYIRLPHRGIQASDVVSGALELAGRFANMRVFCEAMANLELTHSERQDFAAKALRLRYEGPAPIQPDHLLGVRRAADEGSDLWRVYNRVQENLLRGGLAGHSESGRRMHTRAIKAIREDVRINLGLWNLAVEFAGT